MSVRLCRNFHWPWSFPVSQADANAAMELNLSLPANEQDDKTEGDYTTSYGLILMAVVIIVGNGLVLLTVKSFKRRLVADIFIFSLSLSDLTNTLTSVVLAIVFKFTLLHKSYGGKSQDVFRILCQTQAWFTVTTQFQSVFTVTLISLERFVAVSRPFFYKANINPPVALRILGVLFILSVSFSSAPLLGWDEYVLQPKLALCMFRYNSSYAILVVVIGYVHLVLVSYCFLAIRVSLKKFMKRQTYFVRRRGAIAGPQTGDDNTSLKMTKGGEKSLEQSKRLLKVSAMVSFLFYFSWLPLIAAITYAQITNQNSNIMGLVGTLMPLTSPVVNPLIYFFSWERYKRNYIKIVKRFVKCRGQYTRSVETKDLTKVSGANSAIRNLMQNSGSLGRLELVECGNHEGDVCLHDISAPSSPTTVKWSLDKTTGRYSVKGLGYFGNKDSELSRDPQKYSFEKQKNIPRNRISECLSSGTFSEEHNVQVKTNRRHTINDFSENAIESPVEDMSVGDTSHNYVLSGSTCGLQPRKGYIIRSEGAIHQNPEGTNTGGKLPLKESEKKHELFPRRTPNDEKGMKIMKPRKCTSWYETCEDFKLKSGDCIHKCDYVVSNSSCDETKAPVSKKRERNLAKSSKTGTHHKDAGKVHIFDTNIPGKDIVECQRSPNQGKSSVTDGCLITERIREYLASTIEDEESEDSLQNPTFCENGRRLYLEKLELEAATSMKGADNAKKRVTSALRKKYRRHPGDKKCTKKSPRNVKSNEFPRKDNRGGNEMKLSRGFSNSFQKTKNVFRNHRNQARGAHGVLHQGNTANEKDMPVLTYL